MQTVWTQIRADQGLHCLSMMFLNNKTDDICCFLTLQAWADPEEGTGDPDPWKMQVAIGFLRKSVQTSLEKHTQWAQLLFEGGPYVSL